MNLNREFEMARREAVSFLDRKEQKLELKKNKENVEWVVNFLSKSFTSEQINKRKVLDFYIPTIVHNFFFINYSNLIKIQAVMAGRTW